jgi:hypothetical protein
MNSEEVERRRSDVLLALRLSDDPAARLAELADAQLVEFGANGTVHSAAKSQAMVAAGAAALPPINIHLGVSPRAGNASELVRWLLPLMQIEIQSQGGVVQEVLGMPTR